MLGYSTKIKDLPKLEELIVARLKGLLEKKAIHPNYLFCYELPTLWADADEAEDEEELEPEPELI